MRHAIGCAANKLSSCFGWLILPDPGRVGAVDFVEASGGHRIALSRALQIDTSRNLKTHLSIRKQRSNVIPDRQSFGSLKTVHAAQNRAHKRRAKSKFPFSIFHFPVSTGSRRFAPGTVPSVPTLPRFATVGCTWRSGPSAMRSRS